MEYIYHTPSDELTHWGIKGMKWGVRRYQNKDGSLTAAGKKRRAKLEGELEKLGGGKKDSDGSDSAPRKKSVSEMSNKELQEHAARMQLEKNYYDAQRQLAAAVPPKQVSAGRKMVEKFVNEAVVPAATNTGKAYLEKMMKEKMGISTEDPVKTLENTWKKLDYEQKIDKIKNPDKYLSEEDKNKRQQRAFEAETREANRAGYESVTLKAKAEKTERAKAEKDKANYDDEMNKYREYNKAYTEPQSSDSDYSGYRKTSGERTDTNPNVNRGLSVVNSYINTSISSISKSDVSTGRSSVEKYQEYELYDRGGNTLLKSYNSNDDVSYKRDDD